jgi:hypothetical protein
MMGSTERFNGKDLAADMQTRKALFASAHGPDPTAARAALDSLRRLYRLRLPLVEARLNGNGGGRHA